MSLAISAMRAEPEPESKEQLKIVIVGHVDHGKSTLVGRLFHDTGSLPEGKLEAIQQMCARRGMPFEWSFLMDALQTERDQGITIDTSQIWFRTDKRNYVIIDAPGHKEFLKNMITGAASSEAALLIIDAKEGVKEQSRRHGYLLHLLGVRQIAVLINKMDAVGYDEARFKAIESEYSAYLKGIGVTPAYVIPVSAREGDCLVSKSAQMKWYRGPSVVDALDAFQTAPASDHLPLRLPVQDVYKFDERRIIVGRVESGTLKVGDEILFSPANKKAHVASIETWPEQQAIAAVAGQAVGIRLDEQLFVERGHVISHVRQAPVLTNEFHARLFWLGEAPLVTGKRYKIKMHTSEFAGEVKSITRVINTDSLSHTQADAVQRNEVAELVMRVKGMASLDAFSANARMGRFVIVDGYDIVGGGTVSEQELVDQRIVSAEIKSKNIFDVDLRITPQQRAAANGHTGGILWFTGLSGSGKSTLALELQQRLFAKGYQTYVLDGDNIRHGLNADLGFSHRDRTENIRRVGEVAALFARAGIIVITAFISPYREDRQRARTALPDLFNEVYIKADVATCEQRDVKGLYKKARKGEIKDFTGISAPYEEPESSDIIVDTLHHSVEECVRQLTDYVERNFVAPVKAHSGH